MRRVLKSRDVYDSFFDGSVCLSCMDGTETSFANDGIDLHFGETSSDDPIPC